MKNKVRVFKMICVVLMFIIPWIIKADNNMKTINPDAFLVGNSAVGGSGNIYTINPASIGLVGSSMLYQNFALDKNQEKMLFSQNMLLKLSSKYTFLLGYSLMDRNVVTVGDSMFNFNPTINLEDFLYVGANFNYRDEHYKKFQKNKLQTDLGMIVSLKFGAVLKFINFGVYGLDARVEKISIEFPDVNYGKYSAMGFSTGFGISRDVDVILSMDTDLVRDVSVVCENRIYKYGGQLNFGTSSPWLSLKASGEYLRNKVIEYSSGATLNLKFFNLTYANRFNTLFKQNNNYLSVSFQLNIEDKKRDLKDTEEADKKQNEKKIKMYYCKTGENYKIFFTGNRSEIKYWHLVIVDSNKKRIKELEAADKLPEYIIWNGKDDKEMDVADGVYKISLFIAEGEVPGRTSQQEKVMVKSIY